jgi:hypothetical protein
MSTSSNSYPLQLYIVSATRGCSTVPQFAFVWPAWEKETKFYQNTTMQLHLLGGSDLCNMKFLTKLEAATSSISHEWWQQGEQHKRMTWRQNKTFQYLVPPESADRPCDAVWCHVLIPSRRNRSPYKSGMRDNQISPHPAACRRLRP